MRRRDNKRSISISKNLVLIGKEIEQLMNDFI